MAWWDGVDGVGTLGPETRKTSPMLSQQGLRMTNTQVVIPRVLWRPGAAVFSCEHPSACFLGCVDALLLFTLSVCSAFSFLIHADNSWFLCILRSGEKVIV